MIRPVGVMLLAGGAALLGISAARRTKSRVVDLQLLAIGLQAILRELSYRLAPLNELFHSAEEQTGGRVKQFFLLCAQGAEEWSGQTFQTVWEQAAEASQMHLEREDWRCLEALGHVLGRYDCENQRQALEAALADLEERRMEASERSQTTGKLYSVLGMTAAAFLLILLM